MISAGQSHSTLDITASVGPAMKIDIDSIYAQMSEFSHISIRPNRMVMAFIYTNEHTQIAHGGISVWWETPYVSLEQEEAQFTVVDWMHDYDLYLDHMVKLTPIEDGGRPGLMMSWRPIDGPAILSDYVLHYVEGLSRGTMDTGTQDPQDPRIEDGSTSQ